MIPFLFQGDELVQELQKVDRLADQRVALDLLQQLINGILSAYTLARFTIKAYVIQDCYTTSGDKRTIDHIAEILRYIVRPKAELNDQLNGQGTRGNGSQGSTDGTDVPMEQSIKRELAKELVSLCLPKQTTPEGEGEEFQDQAEGSEDPNDLELTDDNILDVDYEPKSKRMKKEVKGAKKRKQGFKVRIKQPTRKALKPGVLKTDLR